MKECPTCTRAYADDTLNFCLDDGSRLVEAAIGHDHPTVILSPSNEAPSKPNAETPDIRFCETADGAGIAYSVIGSGPLLVRVLGHFTHLEMEWEWPDLRHF